MLAHHLHIFIYIKFETKFIIVLCDIFKKIARTRRFYFDKFPHVMKTVYIDQ
jgi:hypothetical protein